MDSISPPGEKTPYELAKELMAMGLGKAEVKRKLIERGVDADAAGMLAHVVGAPSNALELEMDVTGVVREWLPNATPPAQSLSRQPSPDEPSSAQSAGAPPRALDEEQAKKAALLGGSIFLGGVLLLLFSSLLPSLMGVLAVGAVAFGAFRFLRAVLFGR